MRKSLLTIALVLCGWAVIPAAAQQPCPGFSIVVGSPEDQLILGINGAENPEDQLAALDAFVKENPDSKFMPCAQEYYTITYLKQNNYDKVIEHGEQALATGHQDVMLLLNLAKAYVGSGKATTAAFDTILKAPEVIQKEANPTKPAKATDADWEKELQELAEQAKNQRAYMAYVFFQLLPRVPDANQRLTLLDKFEQTFPDAATEYGKTTDYQRFLAYKLAGNMPKLVETGEKAVAADPNNLEVLNLLGYIYANQRTNLDKGEDYAQKALDLATAMKKPEGLTDEQFATSQQQAQGMAHLTLGYIAFQKAEKSKRFGPAAQELKIAAELLGANPGLQAQSLYYLGYAYERMYPANHAAAIEALTRAAALPSNWQAKARDLLAQVKRAAR